MIEDINNIVSIFNKVLPKKLDIEYTGNINVKPTCFKVSFSTSGGFNIRYENDTMHIDTIPNDIWNKIVALHKFKHNDLFDEFNIEFNSKLLELLQPIPKDVVININRMGKHLRNIKESFENIDEMKECMKREILNAAVKIILERFGCKFSSSKLYSYNIIDKHILALRNIQHKYVIKVFPIEEYKYEAVVKHGNSRILSISMNVDIDIDDY